MDKPDPPFVDICVRDREMKDEVTTPVMYAAPTVQLVDASGVPSISYCACDGVNMDKIRMKMRV